MPAANRPSNKQAKQVKGGTDEEARPEVYSVVKDMLESLGLDEHEPQIVDMIIDFVFSYTTDVLQDAHAFSEAAGNTQGTVGQQDVELAIHSRMDMSLAQSPNLENLLKMAPTVNCKPLPEIHGAPGLPMPNKNTLLAPNAQYSRQAAEAAKEAAIEAAKAAAEAAAAAPTAAFPQAAFIPQPVAAIVPTQPIVPVATDLHMQSVSTSQPAATAVVPTTVPAAAVPSAPAAVPAALPVAESAGVPAAAPVPTPVQAPVPTAAAVPAAVPATAPVQPADTVVPAVAKDAAVAQVEGPEPVEDVDMDDDGPQLIPPPT